MSNHKNENEKIDIKTMITAARMNFEAADRLMKEEIIIENKIICYPIPSIILRAISCEIYMKSIIKLEGGAFDKLHDLKTLFDKISKKRGEIIINSVCLKLNINIEDFNTYISENRNVFTGWRYFYEENNTLFASIEFIKELAYQLGELARDIASNGMQQQL